MPRPRPRCCAVAFAVRRTASICAFGRPADADAQRVDPGTGALEPGDQARLGAGAAGPDHHAVDAQAPVVRLLQELQRGVDVAERADRVRAAARDVVWPAAPRPHLLGDLGAGGVHVGVRRDEAEPRPEQPVEQDVAGRLVAGPVPRHPALEQRLALEPVSAGGGRGLADVVGLHGTMGDQGVGALCQRVADQELELARLVAAGREAGAVVALDVEARAAEPPGEVGHRLERGRQMGEVDAGKAGEMHGGGWPSSQLRGGRTTGASLAGRRRATNGFVGQHARRSLDAQP